MPRVMVTTDQAELGGATVLLDEQVQPIHLSSDHSAMQFIERLGWAIRDAEEAERAGVERPARSRNSGARLTPRRRVHARDAGHAGVLLGS
jgi:hypothetical protein